MKTTTEKVNLEVEAHRHQQWYLDLRARVLADLSASPFVLTPKMATERYEVDEAHWKAALKVMEVTGIVQVTHSRGRPNCLFLEGKHTQEQIEAAVQKYRLELSEKLRLEYNAKVEAALAAQPTPQTMHHFNFKPRASTDSTPETELTQEQLADKRFKANEHLFWKKVEPAGECWNYIYFDKRKGYGDFAVVNNLQAGWVEHNLIRRKARHVSLFLTDGVWPVDSDEDTSTCKNPRCVRPDHLRPDPKKAVEPDWVQWKIQFQDEARKLYGEKGLTIWEAAAEVAAQHLMKTYKKA